MRKTLLVGSMILGVWLPMAAHAQRLDLDRASDDALFYVEANLLGIFYHELGHALVDVLDLPIFGQEEDAADVLSVFLLDAFYNNEDAIDLAYNTGFGFLEGADRAPAYWDVHGPDLQRYYNLVCLFYGADPDTRESVAIDMGLPEDRAISCPFEYDQASDSWGGVLDQITSEAGGRSFVLGSIDDSSDAGVFTADLMASEIEALNAEFRLPAPIAIDVVACGQVNAFYDSSRQTIIMCTEFADYLAATTP